MTAYPAFTLQQKLIQSADDGHAADQFGTSVSVSGDIAVVGANQAKIGMNNTQGAAYVFVRTGATWTQQQKLTAADGHEGDQFGVSVSIAGDTLVVGAFGANVGANANQGAAYIFTRTGGTWSQQQKVVAADGQANDVFGSSVSISGDSAIIGAHVATVGMNTSQGAAYVFVRTGMGWSQQQKITAADGHTFDSFAFSVSISGDSAVVGSPNATTGMNLFQGAVYVYERSGGIWSQRQKLTANDGQSNDELGISVSISGDTVIAGAPNAFVALNFRQGAAYAFQKKGGIWTQQKLSASDGQASDGFGTSVSISGDLAIVGAYAATIGKNILQGAVYVLTRTASTWSQRQKLSAADGHSVDFFGLWVSISGDTAVIGARSATVGMNGGQGAAYVFVTPPFDTCLKDDSGMLFQFSSFTGQYRFTRCSDGLAFSGTGVVTLINGIRILTDFRPDRRISAGFNTGQLTGSATIYLMAAPGVWQTFRINSTNPAALCSCGL